MSEEINADSKDIKAAIKARGWLRVRCGGSEGLCHVIQTNRCYLHSATYAPRNKRESLLLAYFLADQDERARAKPAGDEWTELVRAMADEGFSFQAHLWASGDTSFEAWRAIAGAGAGAVYSGLTNPLEALRDLLTQCRAKWPKPESAPCDPWDGLGTDELLEICQERGWEMTVIRNSGVWRVGCACWAGGFRSVTLPDAIRRCMHEAARWEAAR